MTSHTDSNEPQQASDGAERPSLDPSAETMRKLGYNLVDRLVDHLSTLGEQKVAHRGSRSDFMSLVDEPIPRDGVGLANCLDFFFERVVPDLTLVNHPRFHGHIPCPSSFAGAMGEMLAAGTNPFGGSWLGGTTVAALELTVVRWIAEMLSFDPNVAGIFTSGGSTANLIALAAAREKYGRDVMERGVIYVSREGHASIDKAAKILGFRSECIRVVEVDEQFRMRVDELESHVAVDREARLIPFFVAANAGTTNSGAIDPLSAVAQICKEHELWFHVDGAYGGFAAAVPELRGSFAGIDEADSLTLDPHKWLYCPLGTGCVLVRDTDLLERTFTATGDYLKDLPEDEVNFLKRGPELSRPARVLSVWAVLRSVGVDGIVTQIREDLRLAQLAAELLSENELLEVEGVGLSVVTFRHRRKAGETEQSRGGRDDELMEATLASGELMLSTTMLAGKSTLRMVIMNHRTTERDVRRSVATIQKLTK
ncbi:MAG: aromatic-L-amino-acid decarboxylase [Pirellulaceae bacterium]|jgi:aromatic-L-amino-acid decarboxylase